MLKWANRAERRAYTTDTHSVARAVSRSNGYEKRAAPESVGKAFAELALAEHRVSEINTHVEFQRRLIRQLADAGQDITSAQITLDSLLVSLFLAAEDRHRLRALVRTQAELA